MEAPLNQIREKIDMTGRKTGSFRKELLSKINKIFDCDVFIAFWVGP